MKLHDHGWPAKTQLMRYNSPRSNSRISLLARKYPSHFFNLPISHFCLSKLSPNCLYKRFT